MFYAYKSVNNHCLRVEQIGGGSNGGQFQGSVGGKTHHITYKATDDKDLHGYCHFSFVVTGKVPKNIFKYFLNNNGNNHFL